VLTWILLTAFFAYGMMDFPGFNTPRDWLRARRGWIGRFFEALLSCGPCTFGWSGIAAALVAQDRWMLPAWALVGGRELEVLGLVAGGAACGIGLGFLVSLLSPLTAVGYAKRKREG
jgi:hypothetical protein